MSRQKKPYVVEKRSGSKSFLLTLNITCGLPERICKEWQRKSYINFPPELAYLSFPKTKSAAEEAALALITYLKNKQDLRVVLEDITVGEWIEKFVAVETSPRTSINASKNRPYSPDTVKTYGSYYSLHIKDDPITKLKMTETNEEDALDFATRMSVKKLKSERLMGGTRTYTGVMVFIRMAFNAYQRKNRKWINPFQYISTPNYKFKERDALTEDEVIRLFKPGVHKRTIELAVCAAIHLSGLRRSEVFALRPEDLDWHTPKIVVRRTWQKFNSKDSKVLGPPKGKKIRDAPFDQILQDAIKKLWEENGQHEFVFTYVKVMKDKTRKVITPGSSWVSHNFPKWLDRAGIKLNGRIIVPHSARHSLATMLLDHGESLRNIQKVLDHESLKTTKGYLHSTGATIRKMGEKISEAMEESNEKSTVKPFKNVG